MDKARSSFSNLDYGLFPMASDHESAADVWWLIYSIRQKDDDRIADLLSNLTNEDTGAKWHMHRRLYKRKKMQLAPSLTSVMSLSHKGK
jgi:hypothetical protein